MGSQQTSVAISVGNLLQKYFSNIKYFEIYFLIFVCIYFCFVIINENYF